MTSTIDAAGAGGRVDTHSAAVPDTGTPAPPSAVGLRHQPVTGRCGDIDSRGARRAPESGRPGCPVPSSSSCSRLGAGGGTLLVAQTTRDTYDQERPRRQRRLVERMESLQA